MIVEGSETPGGGPPPGPPGGGLGGEGRRRGEGDLLAERRARRVAESGEHALARRADAAEATVRTLEAHVASLQQRLGEAEDARRRAAELAEAERSAPGGAFQEAQAPQRASAEGEGSALEHELRAAKQREFAEQRLRVETEERLGDLERDTHAEVERLGRRLSETGADAHALGMQFESLRRELAEAEHGVGAERTSAQRAEAVLEARVEELERRAVELQRELAEERLARERAERMLEVIRLGHRKMEGHVEDLKDVVARLRVVAESLTSPSPPSPGAGQIRVRPPAPGRAAGEPPRNGEMVDALAAAVERLRARAADPAQQALTAQMGALVSPAPRHRHSMSLITRLRLARKQRRGR